MATTEADVATRLRMVVHRLGRVLRRHAGGELTPSQSSALASLERQGPMTLGDLSAVENVRPPTLTKVVAALQDQNLVRRLADPSDRRVCRVEVTRAGSQLLARSRSRSSAYLVERLSGLPAEDVAAVERALPVLERLLEEED